MSAPSTIDGLLNLVPDRPEVVLERLSAQPELASAQDFSGYSLLHAAVSYEHQDLARRLVNDFSVDVNLKDEDGDAPLCAAESVTMARLLVEELHADLECRNEEGQTPEEKIEQEQEFPLVAAYLREAASRGAGGAGASAVAQAPGVRASPTAHSDVVGGASLPNGTHRPPRVPPGISDVFVGTAPAPDEDDLIDPEIRRRIDELASRDDFQSEAGQAELRSLVSDVVSGMREPQAEDRSTRRRADR